MNRELYIGVDVSKNWLDLAYYDGVDVDWKHGHIRVDNNESGYCQIGKWLKTLGTNRECVLFCMEQFLRFLRFLPPKGSLYESVALHWRVAVHSASPMLKFLRDKERQSVSGRKIA